MLQNQVDTSLSLWLLGVDRPRSYVWQQQPVDCLVTLPSLRATHLQRQRQPSLRLVDSSGFPQIGRQCCHFYVDLYDDTSVWWRVVQ